MTLNLSNKSYDAIKYIALIVLPALATLYAALAALWGLPDTAAVVGTISAVDTFLGGLLRISTASYTVNQPTDGSLTVDPAAGKLTINVESMADIEALVQKKTVTLAVNTAATTPA